MHVSTILSSFLTCFRVPHGWPSSSQEMPRTWVERGVAGRQHTMDPHTSEIPTTWTEWDQSAEAHPNTLWKNRDSTNKDIAELERRSSSQQSLRDDGLWKNEPKRFMVPRAQEHLGNPNWTADIDRGLDTREKKYESQRLMSPLERLGEARFRSALSSCPKHERTKNAAGSAERSSPFRVWNSDCNKS